ncbi:MAG: hypothetical protein ACTSQ4_05030 [Candidatus Heimdallarchaeaceae archaeon]
MLLKKCKVCGVGVGVPRWSPKQGPFFGRILSSSRQGSAVYCSIQCNLIGTAKPTFIASVVLGVVAIGLIIAGNFTHFLPVLLIIFGIMAGIISIVLSLLSATGFYFKRMLGY